MNATHPDPVGGSRARVQIASSPGHQFKFRKKDGLVAIATMLVRMRWPLPEKHVIVYLACKPFRKPFHAKQWQNFMKRWPILFHQVRPHLLS